MHPSIVRAGFVRAAASAIAALLVAASCTSPAPSQPAGESGGVGAPASTTVLTNGKIALLDSKNTIVAALAYRDGEPAPGSFAQLDAAIFGLWQVRDDCHMSAWRATGIAGPDLEVLTRVWRGEAKDESGLFDKLPHQAPADFLASLERLRREGRVARDALRATADGTRFRQGIEDETDRLFFTPWPDDVGREGPWIREALGRVNAALT